jgi:hypothetical protein
VTTFDVDYRVRNCVYGLQDSSLLAKLSIGDLIAVEAHYHASCLISFYRRGANTTQCDAAIDNSHHSGFANNEILAFAQLVEYIGEEKQDTSIALVFKLSGLSKMYHNRLQQLGIKSDTCVHSTRLKKKNYITLPSKDISVTWEGSYACI